MDMIKQTATQVFTKNELVLIADPRVLQVSVQENHEKMVDLKSQSTLIFGPSPEVENNQDYTQMRESVYEKLCQAQSMLPGNLKFCLYEAYRSIKLQKMLFEYRLSEISRRHPDWSEEEIFNETIRMVSPVVNFDGTPNVPPHSTGSAIDVYLVDAHGKALDMGIHPKDWLLDMDGKLSITHSRAISHEARKNRALMSAILSEVGFVNYPTEYWHWSYGDRYWAYMKKKPHAVYGLV